MCMLWLKRLLLPLSMSSALLLFLLLFFSYIHSLLPTTTFPLDTCFEVSRAPSSYFTFIFRLTIAYRFSFLLFIFFSLASVFSFNRNFSSLFFIRVYIVVVINYCYHFYYHSIRVEKWIDCCVPFDCVFQCYSEFCGWFCCEIKTWKSKVILKQKKGRCRQIDTRNEKLVKMSTSPSIQWKSDMCMRQLKMFNWITHLFE